MRTTAHRIGSDDAVRRADVCAVAALAVVAVVTVLAGVSALTDPATGPVPEAAVATWALAPAAVVVLGAPLAVWAARLIRPGVATGLALTAMGLLLPFWAGWSSVPATAGALALVAAPLTVAGLVLAAWRAGALPISPAAQVAVHGMCAAAVVVLLLGYDPFADPACVRSCTELDPPLDGVVRSTTILATAEVLTLTAAAVGAVAATRSMLVTRSIRARPAGQVVAAAVCALVLLTVSRHVRFNDWPPVEAQPWRFGALAVAFILPLLAAAALAVRTARTRAGLDRLLAQLDESATTRAAGEVAPRLVREIQVAVPGDGRWVDLDGRPVHEPGPGTPVIYVGDRTPEARVRILLAPGASPADLAARLTPARSLALANARLAAVTRAHLADVQVSQARIVVAADAERRRIERDLHDGAQQRLVSASFHLSSARNHVPAATAATLAPAGEQIRLGLDQLRRLSHGTFPPALLEDGLGAALHELLADSDVGVTLDDQLADASVDTAAATAGYAVVAAALRGIGRRPRTTVHVSVAAARGLLTIHACAKGSDVPAASLFSQDAADRVGALGGRYDVGEEVDAGGGGGARVTAVVPCGS